MAGVAGGGESTLRMVRVGRELVVLHVARRASPCIQVVVAIHVALRALHFCVRAGKRESRTRMVERRSRPRSRVVASLAGLRELGLHVARVGRASIVLQMAGNASRGGQIKIPVYVAL